VVTRGQIYIAEGMAENEQKMTATDLTNDEQKLFDSLPGPPKKAVLKPTSIWIIEWLGSNDKRTGNLLHEWVQEQRSGWSAYYRAMSKQDVLSSIERAANRSNISEMNPLLHIEAHGDESGLGGPDGSGGEEMLIWDELTEPLQELNLATNCNLIVLVAACIGFAGIKALTKGPRAPAIAIIGPDAKIYENELLLATKEFYRRWMDDGNPNLGEITTCASREAGTASFAMEPFAVLAHEVLAEYLIISMREDQKRKQVNRYFIQKTWDEMFMIDVYPENRERFGVNWDEIVDMIGSSPN